MTVQMWCAPIGTPLPPNADFEDFARSPVWTPFTGPDQPALKRVERFGTIVMLVIVDYRHFRSLEDGFYPDEVAEEGDMNPTTHTTAIEVPRFANLWSASAGTDAESAADEEFPGRRRARSRVYHPDPFSPDRAELLEQVAEEARHVLRAFSGSEEVEDLGVALQALDRETAES